MPFQDKLQSMFSSWSSSIDSIETAVAIKHGLKLTYDQYEGLRQLLSYDLNEAERRQVKTVPNTGYHIEYSYSILIHNFV